MTKEQMARVMEVVFEECANLRNVAHHEYAHDENAFSNFIRLGNYLNVPKEKILAVYAMKHWDGIIAYVNGFKSQRESIKGRINDLIVYLCLLRGMYEEGNVPPGPPK